MPTQLMGWWSSVGCDSSRDETYEDVKTWEIMSGDVLYIDETYGDEMYGDATSLFPFACSEHNALKIAISKDSYCERTSPQDGASHIEEKYT
jgi:hypothetical protein